MGKVQQARPARFELVGDGGLEPPTSTMSTWRSTPELIAQTELPLPPVRYPFANRPN